MKLSSPNVTVAMLNMKFCVLSMNCRRCGDGICQLVKENDLELLDGHPRRECFQVGASAFKPKPTKFGRVMCVTTGVSNGCLSL